MLGEHFSGLKVTVQPGSSLSVLFHFKASHKLSRH